MSCVCACVYMCRCGIDQEDLGVRGGCSQKANNNFANFYMHLVAVYTSWHPHTIICDQERIRTGG